MMIFQWKISINFAILKMLFFKIKVINLLMNSNKNLVIRGILEKDAWKGCFGVQSYINHDFLIYLFDKYNLFQLLPLVTCRADRCCLERIFGILFSLESKYKNASLLGNIHQYQPRFDYTYDKYKADLANKKIPHAVVKVWTGR
jgi:hypothetical protein